MNEMMIPMPEFRIVEWMDYGDVRALENVTVRLTLAIGNCPLVSRTYVYDAYDRDNRELDRCREEFRAYVANRLSRLFGEDDALA